MRPKRPARLGSLQADIGLQRQFQVIDKAAQGPSRVFQQRRDVHPLEEAQGFRALLNLEPIYSIEQIAAKVGKSPVYSAQRLELTERIPAVVGAFYAERIGVCTSMTRNSRPS